MSDMARSALLTLALSGAALAGYLGYRAMLPGGPHHPPGDLHDLADDTHGLYGGPHLPGDPHNPPGDAPPTQFRLAETLPDFSLEDPGGVLRSIRDWEGDALVINFWATWCAPCRREIPLLKAFQDARGATPVQVVGIAVDRPDAVRAFAAEMNFNYPILVGELAAVDVAARLGVDFLVLPFTVFTDTRERVLGVHSGELHAEHLDEALEVLAALEAGTMDLAAARARLSR